MLLFDLDVSSLSMQCVERLELTVLLVPIKTTESLDVRLIKHKQAGNYFLDMNRIQLLVKSNLYRGYLLIVLFLEGLHSMSSELL